MVKRKHLPKISVSGPSSELITTSGFQCSQYINNHAPVNIRQPKIAMDMVSLDCPQRENHFASLFQGGQKACRCKVIPNRWESTKLPPLITLP